MGSRWDRNRTLLRVLTLFRRLDGCRYAPPLAELAKEFGVCERTIRRDLEALEAAGFNPPKYADHYRLREESRECH